MTFSFLSLTMTEIVASLAYGAMMALQPLTGGKKSSSGVGFTDDNQFESSASSFVPRNRICMMKTTNDRT